MHTHWKNCAYRTVRGSNLQPGDVLRMGATGEHLKTVVEVRADISKIRCRTYRGSTINTFGFFPDSNYDVIACKGGHPITPKGGES